ncbi:hypothetical protein [Gordonia sp. NPDC003376]
MFTNPRNSPAVGVTRHDVHAVDLGSHILTTATPRSDPHLWIDYLAGAMDAYRRHDCAAALDLDDVVTGTTTSIFVTVHDDVGRLCGGLRIQPRLTAAAQSHAVEEWSGQPGQVQLVNAIERRLDEGIVEVKTAWVDERSPMAPIVVAQLSRLGLPILQMCDVRYMMATAADHVLRRWASGGGVVDVTVPATPFPDERYRTQLMWWDRTSIGSSTSAEVWERMQDEAALICGRDRRP